MIDWEWETEASESRMTRWATISDNSWRKFRVVFAILLQGYDIELLTGFSTLEFSDTDAFPSNISRRWQLDTWWRYRDMSLLNLLPVYKCLRKPIVLIYDIPLLLLYSSSCNACNKNIYFKWTKKWHSLFWRTFILQQSEQIENTQEEEERRKETCSTIRWIIKNSFAENEFHGWGDIKRLVIDESFPTSDHLHQSFGICKV